MATNFSRPWLIRKKRRREASERRGCNLAPGRQATNFNSVSGSVLSFGMDALQNRLSHKYPEAANYLTFFVTFLLKAGIPFIMKTVQKMQEYLCRTMNN
jgi:hypothetical protein